MSRTTSHPDDRVTVRLTDMCRPETLQRLTDDTPFVEWIHAAAGMTYEVIVDDLDLDQHTVKARPVKVTAIMPVGAQFTPIDWPALIQLAVLQHIQRITMFDLGALDVAGPTGGDGVGVGATAAPHETIHPSA